jgi:hypothetical protein
MESKAGKNRRIFSGEKERKKERKKATNWGERERTRKGGYLNGGEVADVEHARRLRHEHAGVGVARQSPHAGTGVAVAEAGADGGPVLGVGDALAEPAAVVGELVLEEPAVHDDLAVAAVGDGEGEDDEEEEREDDEEHGEEVEAEEPGLAVAGAGEAHEGDDHEDEPHDDDGPLQEADAVGGVGPGRQPDAAAQDGDRDQEGDEVDDPQHARAAAQHLAPLLGCRPSPPSSSSSCSAPLSLFLTGWLLHQVMCRCLPCVVPCAWERGGGVEREWGERRESGLAFSELEEAGWLASCTGGVTE